MGGFKMKMHSFENGGKPWHEIIAEFYRNKINHAYKSYNSQESFSQMKRKETKNYNSIVLNKSEPKSDFYVSVSLCLATIEWFHPSSYEREIIVFKFENSINKRKHWASISL